MRLALLITGLWPPHTPAQGLLPLHDPAPGRSASTGSVGLDLAAAAASDTSSLRALTHDDWLGDQPPSRSVNVTLAMARASLTAERAGWSVALVSRAEGLGRLSSGVVRILQEEVEGTRPAAGGSRYDGPGRLQGWQGDGLRIGRELHQQWGTSTLRYGMALSAYSVRMLRDVRVDGSVQRQLDGGFSIAAEAIDANSRARLPYGPQGTGTGTAWSMDLGMHWSHSRFGASLLVNDALGQIRWDRLATTAYQAASSKGAVDADGYLDYAPTLRFQKTTPRRSLRMASKWQATGEWHITESLGVNAGVAGWQDVYLPWLGIGGALVYGWRWGLDHDLRFGTTGLRIESGTVSLTVRSNRQGVSDIGGAVGLLLQWRMPL